MAYQRSFDETDSRKLPPCLYLRSKAIYVTGDPDPRTPEEFGSTRFDCWCNRTQRVIGPDDLLVDRSQCVVGRDCFVPRGES